ncbi:MAG: Spy/CpxP family protein refolding chaperone [Elusimicrobiota bacterium]
MKDKKFLKALAMTLFILSGSCALSADDNRKGGENMMRKDFEKSAKELKLTEEQKDKIEKHRNACKLQMKEIRAEMTKIHKDLKEVLNKAETDKTKVDGLIEELKKLHAKQLESMVDRVAEMKKILTPDQFKKMNEMMEKRMKKTDDKMKKMRKGTRGPGMKGPGMCGKGPCMDGPFMKMPL